MPKPPSTFASVEDLLDLDRHAGIDMRPTLLRVLTDLYLQKRTHPPEDERYYTELALRLIDATDVPARAALAARLAPYPAAPRAVVARLARDVLEVAEPILKQSPCLTPADLEAIAGERGFAYAAIIATRGQPSAPIEANGPAPGKADARAAIGGFGALRAVLCGGSGRAPLDSDQSRLCVDHPCPAARPPAAHGHLAPRIGRAAAQFGGGGARAGTRARRPATQARRIVQDELGEPIVVAGKAMRLPADVLQRMLLFINPRVGQSVERVYELASLHGEISVDAARRLIAIWRDADQTVNTQLRHEASAWRAAADNARRALSEVSRRPMQTTEDGRRTTDRTPSARAWR